ncbi:MAG: PDZ domain-containing protein, partial [Planctomycetes bacterium]|nr:PDZ domain-containing protein [Planctomycetota bacterium]
MRMREIGTGGSLTRRPEAGELGTATERPKSVQGRWKEVSHAFPLGSRTLSGCAVAEDRAYLGVGIAPAPEEQPGLLITEVTEKSAAAAAGLKEGDILVEFDGQKIERVEQLLELVRSKKPGEEVTYLYRRGEGSISGTLVMGKRGIEGAPTAAVSRNGSNARDAPFSRCRSAWSASVVPPPAACAATSTARS